MFATSGRARLAYTSAGAGPDVLLLHAGVNDQRSWQPRRSSASSNHRCVAYDARGYGETTYEREDGWSPVADAVAVLDAAGIERAIVVACSMGGKTAVDLTLAHPERVSRLVPDRRRRARRPVRRRDRARHAERGRLRGRRLRRVRPPRGVAVARRPDRARGSRHRRRPGAVPGDERPRAAGARTPATRPTFRRRGRAWARSRCRRWCCSAGSTSTWIQQVDEAAAERIPGARLQWLDGVAHVPHLEGDPATLDAIEAFVSP